MIPNSVSMLGMAGLVLGTGLFREAKPRTDSDRLKEIDLAEKKYLAMISNPVYIAAQEKRERKRLKRIKNG
jgi:hypothetical protein